ncbi:MAG: Crp/Fnr family transcriptional regulator [Rhizomicrobium sp.]
MKISEAAASWLLRLDPKGSFREADRRTVVGAISHVRAVTAHQILEREGGLPGSAMVPVTAFLCRSKETASGHRQIVSLSLPGELLIDDYATNGELDYSIEVSSAGWVAMVPLRTLASLARGSERLRLALAYAARQDNAIAREWVVNLGSRSARARLAHLFCEIVWRLGAAHLVAGNRCHIPLSQETLANATGMSPVHCNRSLQWLRRQKLLRFDNGVLYLDNIAALNEVAEFDPAYLERSYSAQFVEQSRERSEAAFGNEFLPKTGVEGMTDSLNR